MQFDVYSYEYLLSYIHYCTYCVPLQLFYNALIYFNMSFLISTTVFLGEIIHPQSMRGKPLYNIFITSIAHMQHEYSYRMFTVSNVYTNYDR
jgi:hypothetical protein